MPEIDDDGRVPIPPKIRERLHLEPGTTVTVEPEASRIVIEPQRSPEEIIATLEAHHEAVRNGEIERADTVNEDDPFARRHREAVRSGIDDG